MRKDKKIDKIDPCEHDTDFQPGRQIKFSTDEMVGNKNKKCVDTPSPLEHENDWEPDKQIKRFKNLSDSSKKVESSPCKNKSKHKKRGECPYQKERGSSANEYQTWVKAKEVANEGYEKSKELASKGLEKAKDVLAKF